MKTLRLIFASFVAAAVAALVARPAEPASLLPSYEKVSTALVADNLPAAREEARQLATEAAELHRDDLAIPARAVAEARDLAAARQSFKALSSQMVVIARKQRGFFILHCPMADADWVQSTRQVANPYFGQSMASCGEVTEETKD